MEPSVAIFNKLGLQVTIEPNQTKVNFLDITMDLENESYRPFIKPNTTPLYIHTQSNHPPSIIRNIPIAVNKRLSSISSSKEEFNKATPIFKEALAKTGYKAKLEFDPEATRKNKNKKIKKSPSRDVTWYNPPFSLNVQTKVGQKFLQLIDKCFPKNHPLRQICNRNTIKVSYRCTPNIGAAISANNSKLLEPKEKNDLNTCNCDTKENCPVQGKCLENEVIYRATLTEEGGEKHTYTGLTANKFKDRWSGHKHTFNNEQANQTTLSSLTHELKNKNINFEIKWEIVDRAKPFNPVTGICALCTREKYLIAFEPNGATLNKRSELYSSCRHKEKMLLIKKKRKNRTLPQTKT